MNNNMTYKRRRKRRTFNKNGIQINNGLDLCDCMNKICSGCFFPCKKCNSKKCGPTCRVNRRFKYTGYIDEIDRHVEEAAKDTLHQ